jgi:hypothetical protein
MKDMRDVNDGGEVYGFVTTGETWRMLKYDGKSFTLITVAFASMEREMDEGELRCGGLHERRINK